MIIVVISVIITMVMVIMDIITARLKQARVQGGVFGWTALLLVHVVEQTTGQGK
jgi:hypothetical protein